MTTPAPNPSADPADGGRAACVNPYNPHDDWHLFQAWGEGHEAGRAQAHPSPGADLGAVPAELRALSKAAQVPEGVDHLVKAIPYLGRCTHIVGWEFSDAANGIASCQALAKLADGIRSRIAAEGRAQPAGGEEA